MTTWENRRHFTWHEVWYSSNVFVAGAVAASYITWIFLDTLMSIVAPRTSITHPHPSNQSPRLFLCVVFNYVIFINIAVDKKIQDNHLRHWNAPNQISSTFLPRWSRKEYLRKSYIYYRTSNIQPGTCYLNVFDLILKNYLVVVCKKILICQSVYISLTRPEGKYSKSRICALRLNVFIGLY